VHNVILSSQQLNWEAAHATLACIESIPDMIHHSINCVVKASLLVQDKDRLHSSIPGVLIEIFDLEKANVSSLANV